MNKRGSDVREAVGRIAVIICLLLVLSTMAAWLLSQETADGLYEAALLKKEAEGDLQGAIQLFQKILKTYPDKREVAAKAQFQIGLCYEKSTDAINTGSNPVLTTMSKRYSESLIQDLNNGFARVGQR